MYNTSRFPSCAALCSHQPSPSSRPTPIHTEIRTEILFSWIIAVWSAYTATRTFSTSSEKSKKILLPQCRPTTCPPTRWRSSSNWRCSFCCWCLESCGRFWKNSCPRNRNASRDKSCWWVVLKVPTLPNYYYYKFVSSDFGDRLRHYNSSFVYVVRRETRAASSSSNNATI